MAYSIWKSFKAIPASFKNKGTSQDNNADKKSDNGARKTAGEEPHRGSLPSAGSSWTDLFSDKDITFIDKNAIEYFVRSAKSLGRMPEGTSMEPEAVLKRFGMINQEGKISLAAALLFGKPNDAVNGSIVKIGEFSDNGELVREDIIDIPIIMQPDAITKALFEKYIPDTFEYVDARRNVVNRYPRKAIRESVVNAIVHKQYEYREPILVRITTNNVEVYNPGGLPDRWAAEDLVRKHSSVRRNERMAEVFHEAGFSESWGKGIGMMCEACKENGNPVPEFTVRHGGLEVLFWAKSLKPTASNKQQSDANSYDDMPDELHQEPYSTPVGQGVPSGLSATPPGGFRPDLQLTESEAIVYKAIAENARITVSQISSSSGLSERHIYRITKSLSDRAIIRREGSRKNGSWKIN